MQTGHYRLRPDYRLEQAAAVRSEPGAAFAVSGVLPVAPPLSGPAGAGPVDADQTVSLEGILPVRSSHRLQASGGSLPALLPAVWIDPD